MFRSPFFSISIFVILCCSTGLLFSDDGSWSSSFRISGGSVYSEDEDERIILEKELLIFTGESTEVYFLFRNTSEDDVILDCGFPVVHRIDARLRDGYAEIPLSKYGGGDIPGLDFFRTVPRPADPDEDYFDVYPRLVPDDGYNNGREFIGPEIPGSAGIVFSISQDGSEVGIDDILLEREVGERHLGLVFHFKHRLRFPAGGTSTVSVSYSQDLLSGNHGGLACNTYSWAYIIGTGGTWKGPIGELFFIKPALWQGEVAGIEKIPGLEGLDVYYAEDWEPAPEAEFTLGSVPVSMMEEFSFYSDISDYYEIWLEGLSRMEIPEEPAQPFVSDIAASSALEGVLDVFLDYGMRASSGFSAASAFDGFEETSWSENVRGPGEGEYLEVDISRRVSGVIIRNGFKRLPFEDWVYETGSFASAGFDVKSGFRDYFSLNGRVRRLEITGADGGGFGSLELQDRRDPQLFFGLDLPPGRYRFTVVETLAGSRWEDTCIAEITFIENPGGKLDMLFSDPFYRRRLGVRIYN